MEVRFREIDPFNCWIWLHFVETPGKAEMSYVDGIFDSWYVIGRLGGFNSENLQAHDVGTDLSWMTYDNEHSNSSMAALMHNMGELEYKDDWARCWVDLGTCDPISLDILINSFKQIDNDIVELNQILIGGENEEWPVDEHPDSVFPSPEKS